LFDLFPSFFFSPLSSFLPCFFFFFSLLWRLVYKALSGVLRYLFDEELGYKVPVTMMTMMTNGLFLFFAWYCSSLVLFGVELGFFASVCCMLYAVRCLLYM
jgi:hypothetical protein